MPGPKIVRPSSDRAARIRVSASEMVGGSLKPVVNWLKIVEPMPMMTASTRILMPDDTTLPSTFSARKAVRPNSPKGTRTNPASVVSLNSIRLTKSWIAITKKLRTTISQATSKIRNLHKVGEDAGESHHAGDRGQDRLAGVDADLGDIARLKELRGADGSAARLDSKPGEGVVDDLREVVVVADDEGEDADSERLPDEPRDHVLVRRHRPEEAGQRDVDGDEDAGEPADIALHQAEAGIDVLGEGPEETVDDAGPAHDAYLPDDFCDAAGEAASLGVGS